jgi:hypothetical protein
LQSSPETGLSGFSVHAAGSHFSQIRNGGVTTPSSADISTANCLFTHQSSVSEILSLHQQPLGGGFVGVIAFYEKVIKVKADVAAFLN